MPDQSDVIETYLDHVCGHLQVIPEDDLAEIRGELREHLQLSVDALISEGVDPDAAAVEAIRRFGPASRIGNRMLATFPYVWTWDWEGYSIKSVPSPPVALRIYFFWGTLLVSAVGSLAPVVGSVVALLGCAAFGAAFESYRYIRDSFEIEARAPFARRGDLEKCVEATVKPSRLYQHMGLNKLPAKMRACSADELPSVMSSNIGTILVASVFADIEFYYVHHQIPIGIGLFFYAYILGAITFRVFLRYAAGRPGLLFTFREHADVETA